MPYMNYQKNRIFYKVVGEGEPIVLLHGDSASSKMFELLLPVYQEQCKVIVIDFLGNGLSDRVGPLPATLWFTQAQQVIALVEYLQCGKVSLIGTSGGAWVAMNAALERPDLFNKIVADSFDGRTLADDFSKNLIKERAFAKRDVQSQQFYEWCQGEDWEEVVDRNTEALLACANTRVPLFQKPLETLSIPVMFIGSMEDTMCRKDMLEEYHQMNRLVRQGVVHFFKTGGHPAILSNAEEFADIVIRFLKNDAV